MTFKPIILDSVSTKLLKLNQEKSEIMFGLFLIIRSLENRELWKRLNQTLKSWIRRPVFRGAPRLRISNTVCFSAVILLSTVQPSAVERCTVRDFPLPPAWLRIRDTTKNSINVQACFQGTKTQKNWSQGLLTTKKIDSEMRKKRLMRKNVFCITFHTTT